MKGRQEILGQRSPNATYGQAHEHIILRIRIRRRYYNALLDSGAQGNYASPKIINQDKIPWHWKEEPYRLSTVEGQEVSYGQGVINMETDHLPVSIQGRTTQVTFDITDTAQHELILGLPWLRAENPRIDWTTGQLFWDNAVTHQRVTIKGEGWNSVTEDSQSKRRSNEFTDTFGKERAQETAPFGKTKKNLASGDLSPGPSKLELPAQSPRNPIKGPRGSIRPIERLKQKNDFSCISARLRKKKRQQGLVRYPRNTTTSIKFSKRHHQTEYQSIVNGITKYH